MVAKRSAASRLACAILSGLLALYCFPAYAYSEPKQSDATTEEVAVESNVNDSGEQGEGYLAAAEGDVTLAAEDWAPGEAEEAPHDVEVAPSDSVAFEATPEPDGTETRAVNSESSTNAVAEDAAEGDQAAPNSPILESQATANDLLNDEIWLKQKTGGECTLASAAMLLRRAAILNGVSDWRSITDESIRGAAWTYAGLRWAFTYRGMTVEERDLSSSNEQVLIALLKSHPEGVVAYSSGHTVLLTDYTDGVLYCADPAYGDRRPLSRADRTNANNITQYWVVTSSVEDVEPENGGRTGEGPHVVYRTHVQNVGWQNFRADGVVSGTSGRSLRLEGIEITLEDMPSEGGISYRTHVQNVGWQDWVSDGAMSGTSGKSLRLEAIEIKLTGELAKSYDVYYRVHAQNIGWMGWAKNGERAGTATFGYRLEAIQIVMVKKDGGAAPSGVFGGIEQATSESFRQKSIQYRTHVQNVGWQDWSYDGRMAGTSGRSLRLEGIEISLQGAAYAGSIEYCTHVQNIGWQDWVSDGAMSGTSGQSLRLEAIRIRLTGDMAKHYDVYYRVHAQNVGWMGWAKNGGSAGTAGFSYRLEGIQIALVERGSGAPSTTFEGITQTVDMPFVQKD